MKTLLTQIQNVDASSTWRYSETCRDQYTGAFPTGDISCSAAMSLQQSVTRAAQISQLHESYFKIIDANEQFLPVDELDLTPSDAFGKKFVVSTAERRYEVKDIADVSCRYILSLGQRDESSTNFSIGSPIEDSRGTVLISITCTGDATNYWYAKE